jgi:hypothetical protein
MGMIIVPMIITIVVVAIYVNRPPEPFAIDLVVQVGSLFIDSYLVTVIQVIIAVPRRQTGSECPSATIHIYKLSLRNIVICLYVGQVIIICGSIAGGQPGGKTNLNVHPKTGLSFCLTGNENSAHNYC